MDDDILLIAVQAFKQTWESIPRPVQEHRHGAMSRLRPLREEQLIDNAERLFQWDNIEKSIQMSSATEEEHTRQIQELASNYAKILYRSGGSQAVWNDEQLLHARDVLKRTGGCNAYPCTPGE